MAETPKRPRYTLAPVFPTGTRVLFYPNWPGTELLAYDTNHSDGTALQLWRYDSDEAMSVLNAVMWRSVIDGNQGSGQEVDDATVLHVCKGAATSAFVIDDEGDQGVVRLPVACAAGLRASKDASDEFVGYRVTGINLPLTSLAAGVQFTLYYKEHSDTADDAGEKTETAKEEKEEGNEHEEGTRTWTFKFSPGAVNDGYTSFIGMTAPYSNCAFGAKVSYDDDTPMVNEVAWIWSRDPIPKKMIDLSVSNSSKFLDELVESAVWTAWNCPTDSKAPTNRESFLNAVDSQLEFTLKRIKDLMMYKLQPFVDMVGDGDGTMETLFDSELYEYFKRVVGAFYKLFGEVESLYDLSFRYDNDVTPEDKEKKEKNMEIIRGYAEFCEEATEKYKSNAGTK